MRGEVVEQPDPRASSIWLVSTIALVVVLGDPVADLVVLTACSVVAASGHRDSPFRGFLLLGISILLIRTTLFAVTGHTGSTVLFRLPELRLPAPIEIGIGGPVTAEVVSSGLVEGFRFVAVIACIGAFLAISRTSDLLRLIPRFLFEAGLVVGIAMSFAPNIARTARNIREAQVMRGSGRGFSAAGAVAVPVLATALEKSISLAESMDSRGYGRAPRAAGPAQSWRSSTALSLIALGASSTLWVFGWQPMLTAAVSVMSMAALVLSTRQMSRLSARTSYKPGRWQVRDSFIAGTSIVALMLGIVLSAQGIIDPAFDPYFGSLWPHPDPAAISIAALAAAPGILNRWSLS